MFSTKLKRGVVFTSLLLTAFVIYKLIRGRMMDRFTYIINKTWDGKPIPPIENVEVKLERGDNAVRMHVKAPFANSPASPVGKSGESFDQLWDYEACKELKSLEQFCVCSLTVVEAFFLSDSGQYLEVELCPHGQHLVLMLNGRRNKIKDLFPLKFTSSIQGDQWSGTADIPLQYFPPKVTKFNAYAIRGSDEDRTYYALFQVPGNEPDFHRLEYFQEIGFEELVPENGDSSYTSPNWS